MENKSGVSGVTIIRNARKLGYPLFYSVKSVIDACDEFIISEGFSEDGTEKIINSLIREFPGKITVVHDYWKKSTRGQTIAEVTNRAIANCKYEWIYYLQADEIVHESNLPLIRGAPKSLKKFNSVSFPFVHFRPTLKMQMVGGYPKAIRFFRNLQSPLRKSVRVCLNRLPPRLIFTKFLHLPDPTDLFKDVYSIEDAFTFEGAVFPVFRSKTVAPVFHVGHVIRENTEMVERFRSHFSNYYSSLPIYGDFLRRAEAWDGSMEKYWYEVKPYQGSNYPRLLLEWAAEENLEYNH